MTKSFLKKLAKREQVTTDFLEKQFAKGRVVVPLNNRRKIENPIAIGDGLKVKVNANIGISPDRPDIAVELEKLRVAVKCGAHTVMDLSVGTNLKKARQTIIKNSTVPVGTVPIYEAASAIDVRKGEFEKMRFDDFYDVLKDQAEDGVDFFTIHAGILRSCLDMIMKKKRVGGIVSRGGAILSRWMHCNKKENPLYENFDAILKLAKKYNITLSLGDALRPGAIADSTDGLQLAELNVLGGLVRRCRKAGVQAMVEGPGHIKLDEISFNMHLQKKLCDQAPFYVLGPLPIDIAAGYDHITSSIGGAIAAMNGANFLCVVTPAEHLRHPSVDDVRDGVIASRIAAHAVDVLNFPDEWQKDYDLSTYRAKRHWDGLFPLALDEKKAREYRQQASGGEDICTMCGDFCALKIVEKCSLLK